MTTQKSTTELVSWNVNGLRACRKKTFDQFVESRMPDVLCLQRSSSTRRGYKGRLWVCFQALSLSRKERLFGDCGFEEETACGVRSFPGGKHGGEGRMITCEFDGFFLVHAPQFKEIFPVCLPLRFWDPDLKDYLIGLRAKNPWFCAAI